MLMFRDSLIHPLHEFERKFKSTTKMIELNDRKMFVLRSGKSCHVK